MLVIKPIIHETIWGGNRLAKYCQSTSQNIGHLYSLISNGNFESEILNGTYKGQLFKTYFDKNKARLNLNQYDRFPFLVALVDASDDLSLQVHPNDKVAKELENVDFGKNESFYFLEAPKSGKIFMGCKAENLQDLQEKIALGQIEAILNYLPIKIGDYVYIEAGTIHALSAGSLVYEIEENCEATYRIYDFDRVDKNGKKREIHLDSALKSICLNKKSTPKRYSGEIKERFYSTQLFENQSNYTNLSQTIECLTFLSQETLLNKTTQTEKFALKKGSTIVLEPNESIQFSKSNFIVARPVINITTKDKK